MFLNGSYFIEGSSFTVFWGLIFSSDEDENVLNSSTPKKRQKLSLWNFTFSAKHFKFHHVIEIAVSKGLVEYPETTQSIP